MVNFCLQFNQAPSEYYALTLGELETFYEKVQPKTDLTGLF